MASGQERKEDMAKWTRSKRKYKGREMCEILESVIVWERGGERRDTSEKKRDEISKLFKFFVSRMKAKISGIDKSHKGPEAFGIARLETARDEHGTKWKNQTRQQGPCDAWLGN
jgi:hypothetical protein